MLNLFAKPFPADISEGHENVKTTVSNPHFVNLVRMSTARLIYVLSSAFISIIETSALHYLLLVNMKLF